jgi:[FeFe] hydrogenase H-cluster maturation GTPase HydF
MSCKEEIMINTPKANRVHIGIFGRRNSGKSSLINAITNQSTAIVSSHPGTTTDPVYKAMELLPIGPISLIDTAGFDDVGSVGSLRVKESQNVLKKTDLAVLVFNPENNDFEYEKKWLEKFKEMNVKAIGVINKIDVINEDFSHITDEFHIPFVKVSAKDRINIDGLKKLIIKNIPNDYERDYIVRDIIAPNSLVVLVAPQDIQAPKGRLILPQVQTLRDLLDGDALVFTVKDDGLEEALKALNKKPDLVITDSQVFGEVNDILPEDIPLTSFSVLMARYKGDLEELIKGAEVIDMLKDGDKVLIAEACTHHTMDEDIGRIKIPNWLRKNTGADLEITINTGKDFEDDLAKYKLIIHCGACMFNRKQMLSRIEEAKKSGTAITNYGVCIAHLKGILPRVTSMFEY